MKLLLDLQADHSRQTAPPGVKHCQMYFPPKNHFSADWIWREEHESATGERVLVICPKLFPAAVLTVRLRPPPKKPPGYAVT
jgi:hypothetical protein